jgi:Na+-transporting methylmalonyl-CoA/oxaloacetate decarboxylase beta subunit
MPHMKDIRVKLNISALIQLYQRKSKYIRVAPFPKQKAEPVSRFGHNSLLNFLFLTRLFRNVFPLFLFFGLGAFVGFSFNIGEFFLQLVIAG